MAAKDDSSIDIWLWVSILGAGAFFWYASNVKLSESDKERLRKYGHGHELKGVTLHHELEARKAAARAAGSTSPGQALIAAQTAYVHAVESGNQTLLKRVEKQRDLFLNRVHCVRR